jgi:aerobic-type carbon monoxide dehydrogenase small subunit (CoxS/CutS family)
VKRKLEITVNDEVVDVEIEPHKTLLEVLREELGFTGAKEGCGLGACGACTVLLDGDPVLACLTLALEVRDRRITTIEGLVKNGRPDPLQQAFVDHGAIQCGFCTPGAIMSAKSLLGKNPHPSSGEIREALAGNLCRCTGYEKIIKAVESQGEKH